MVKKWGSDKQFSLKHPLGFIISNELEEEKICKEFQFDKEDMGNGFVWYMIPETKISGKSLQFKLSFNDGKLEQIYFYVVDLNDSHDSWCNWSRKNEEHIATQTKEWLEDLGYKIGNFNWGSIWVGFDSQSGSGYGSVRYKW